MPKAHRIPRSWPVGVVDEPSVDNTNPTSDPSPGDVPRDVRSVRPPVKASKAEWVAYAEQLGVDSSGTKRAIQKRIGDS